MPTRSGKYFLKLFPIENQPFNTILLPEKIKYDNTIDFDKSKIEWRLNKVPLSNGMFRYTSM